MVSPPDLHAQPTAAQAMAEFTARLRPEDVPASLWSEAWLHLLDNLGVMLANCPAEYAGMVHRVAVEMGGREEATAVGFGSRLPAALTALVNGSLARGQDYDDTHCGSITHPGGIVTAAALAMAERQWSTGADLLAAMICGYEITTRVGATAPGTFHALGFHTSAVCTAFGCAAAAGKLLGLDADGLANALGIVGNQSSGLVEFVNGGTWVKRLQSGWSAHSGVAAALLAQQGFAGPPAVLEGKYGFLRTHLGAAPFDEGQLTRGLGSEWAISQISVKLYPACHHIAGPLDAVLELRERHHLRPEDVRQMVGYVPRESFVQICEPAEMKLTPATPYAAQFSLAYSLAAALIEGNGDAIYSEDKIHDPAILELARRVSYAADAETIFPAAYGGGVHVVLADGRKLHRHVPACKGSPQNPASTEEIVSKFQGNARGVLGPEAADRVVEVVRRLDSVRDVGELTGLLRGEAGVFTDLAAPAGG